MVVEAEAEMGPESGEFDWEIEGHVEAGDNGEMSILNRPLVRRLVGRA